MTRHYHVSLLVLLGLAIGIAWWFSRADGGITQALETLWTSGHEEAKTAGKFHAHLADSSRKVAAAVDAAQRLARANGALRHIQDTALARIHALALLVDSAHRAPLTQAVQVVGDACHAVEENCEHRVGRFAQALETEHARAELAISRVSRADSIIAAGLKVTECRWLLFTCPSRTTVAEVSLLVGVVGTLVVRR